MRTKRYVVSVWCGSHGSRAETYNSVRTAVSKCRRWMRLAPVQPHAHVLDCWTGRRFEFAGPRIAALEPIDFAYG